jgi:hypothetical protein
LITLCAVPVLRGKIACFFCDQVGHYKLEFPKKVKWDTFKLTTMGEANAVFTVDNNNDKDEDAF